MKLSLCIHRLVMSGTSAKLTNDKVRVNLPQKFSDCLRMRYEWLSSFYIGIFSISKQEGQCYPPTFSVSNFGSENLTGLLTTNTDILASDSSAIAVRILD